MAVYVLLDQMPFYLRRTQTLHFVRSVHELFLYEYRQGSCFSSKTNNNRELNANIASTTEKPTQTKTNRTENIELTFGDNCKADQLSLAYGTMTRSTS